MAMQFGSGTQQRRGDTRWVLLEKILIATNNIAGGGGGGLVGAGSPQGIVTANAGTTYLDTNTGDFGVKKTGSGNTGWLALIGGPWLWILFLGIALGASAQNSIQRQFATTNGPVAVTNAIGSIASTVGPAQLGPNGHWQLVGDQYGAIWVTDTNGYWAIILTNGTSAVYSNGVFSLSSPNSGAILLTPGTGNGGISNLVGSMYWTNSAMANGANGYIDTNGLYLLSTVDKTVVQVTSNGVWSVSTATGDTLTFTNGFLSWSGTANGNGAGISNVIMAGAITLTNGPSTNISGTILTDGTKFYLTVFFPTNMIFGNGITVTNASAATNQIGLSTFTNVSPSKFLFQDSQGRVVGTLDGSTLTGVGLATTNGASTNAAAVVLTDGTNNYYGYAFQSNMIFAVSATVTGSGTNQIGLSTLTNVSPSKFLFQGADGTIIGTLDGSTLTINANNITSGTLPAGAFPALTGDITTTAGSLATTLKNTGTAGTYTKTTFDAQGRETSGASAVLASADFANQGTTTTVLHGNAAGNPSFGSTVEADFAFTDVTTANSSTSQHGLLKKLDNTVTHFMDGTGNWSTPAGGGSGTVTSVGLAAPGEFTVSGSPVTTSGTLTFAKANQNANLVYAGPTTGAAAAPTFRALVSADLPASTFAITTTNITLNTLNTNNSGGGIFIGLSAALTTATVSGAAELDLMIDQNGGNSYTAIRPSKVTTIVGTLGMVYTWEASAWLLNNATWYVTNSSAGSGDSASIVAGTCQIVTGLGGSGSQYASNILSGGQFPNNALATGSAANAIPYASSSSAMAFLTQNGSAANSGDRPQVPFTQGAGTLAMGAVSQFGKRVSECWYYQNSAAMGAAGDAAPSVQGNTGQNVAPTDTVRGHVTIYTPAVTANTNSLTNPGTPHLSTKSGVFDYFCRVTNGSNWRLWVALTTTSGTLLSNQETGTARNVIGFLGSSTNWANWQFVTDDSNAAHWTITDTGVPVTTPGTNFSIILNASGGALSSAVGKLNGVLVATNSSNLPTGPFRGVIGITTLTTAAAGVDVYWHESEQDP